MRKPARPVVTLSGNDAGPPVTEPIEEGEVIDRLAGEFSRLPQHRGNGDDPQRAGPKANTRRPG